MCIKGMIVRGVALSLVGMATMIGCQDDETPLKEESQLVAEESVTESYFSDIDDMAGIAVLAIGETNTGTSEGRSASDGRNVDDDRFDCATITVELDPASTNEHPKGTITIDFGDGCTGPDGKVRKGKIVISFDGKRFMPGSVIVLTFEDYSVNNIKLEGVRTWTNLTSGDLPTFNVKLEDGKATDTISKKFITREHCYTKQLKLLAGELHVLSDKCDAWNVHASGTLRNGQEYTVEILETLVYKRRCPIAVAGKKQFTVGDRTIIIDYGSGECDRAVVISLNGTTRAFDVSD